MAKISNQDEYNEIIPEAADYVVGTDVSDMNQTKTFTLGSISDYVIGQYGATKLGWARYDTIDGPVVVGDGGCVTPNMDLVANVNINPYTANDKFEFTTDDVNSVYIITVVFNAAADNTNSTHVDINFLSGATDYERLSKSIAFYKGNGVTQNFHEVFQFYVDSDLVTYGLTPKICADGGDITVSNAIYFIQKTQ